MQAKIKATGEVFNIASYATVTLDNHDSFGNSLEKKFEEVEEWALEHQWNDVNKSLPDYDEDVLVTINGIGSWFTHRTNDSKVLKDKYDFALFTKKERIRYWMSIPKLTK